MCKDSRLGFVGRPGQRDFKKKMCIYRLIFEHQMRAESHSAFIVLFLLSCEELGLLKP